MSDTIIMSGISRIRQFEEGQRMAEPRIRKVDTEKESDQLVDDYITQGYNITSRGEKSTMLRKNSWGSGGGHLLVALLTVWWTLGIGNLVYAIVSHYKADRVLVRISPQT